MIDRKKVVKELKQISDFFSDVCRKETNIFDYTEAKNKCGIVEDAIALLKEQEPVKPIDENYWDHTIGRCGRCKAPLPMLEGLASKFCWMCGSQVKWHD